MPFDWQEFLHLAKDLMGQKGAGYSQEAVCRTVVSRAYYAAFCSARNYAALHLGFRPKRSSKDHKRLRDLLRNRGKTDLAAKLDRLRQWRNRCDYDDQVNDDVAKIAEGAIAESEAFLQGL